MPGPESAFGWQEASAAFAVVVIAAFLVTWVVTDILRVPRAGYIAILGLMVLGLGSVYLAWSGTSVTELVVSRWGWGLAAGVAAAAIVAPLVRRLPSHPHPGVPLSGALLWEGVVYGFGEAVLLATLPVLAVWQASADRGWTEGGWARAGAGAMAIAGALLVILVHHLGYAEFRARAARPKLVGALFSCGLQALAFLLTGNIVAPILAHIALHGQMTIRGVELPPVAPRSSSVSTTRSEAPMRSRDRARS